MVRLFEQIFGIVEIARHIAEMSFFIVNITEIKLTHLVFFVRIVVDISFIDIAQDFICIELLVENHPYHLHPRIETWATANVFKFVSSVTTGSSQY